MMSNWNGTIIGPGHVRGSYLYTPRSISEERWHTQSVHENRIYSLKIHCGPDYPDAPPTVQFLSRVNLPFVSQTDGKVNPSKLPVLAHWNRNHTMETVLVEIRRYVYLKTYYRKRSELSS